MTLHELRVSLGLTQAEFWEGVGVSQSGGSRYELGQPMPQATAELVRLKYVERLDLTAIKQLDLEIIELCKTRHAAFWRSLRARVLKDRPAPCPLRISEKRRSSYRLSVLGITVRISADQLDDVLKQTGADRAMLEAGEPALLLTQARLQRAPSRFLAKGTDANA